ncbi:MAG: gamma-glutamyltransferase [bacterium]|nr:gamma-glutamyltransferase [bacterium]
MAHFTRQARSNWPLKAWCLLFGLCHGTEAAPAMVVAAHPLAAEAGAAVLEEGGTAADAAVAVALVLAVVEPQASGLGGGGFALVRSPIGTIESIDYREEAPRDLRVEVFFDPADTLHTARSRGGTAVAVPGAAAGLGLLHERHGRLPLDRLAAPAIRLARDGFPVSPSLAALIGERAGQFLTDSSFTALFLPTGLPPMEGDSLRNPGLARALEEIAAGGFAAFPARRGEAIAAAVRDAGGWLTAGEMASYQAIVREPLRSQWRGHTLVGAPPPASGALAAMQTLEILEPLDLSALDEAGRIHVISEALRKALRDRARHCADPAFHATPVDSLLAPDLARAALARIHPDAIQAVWPALGSRPYWEAPADQRRDMGNTTHISVWDGEGGVVSLTQSINYFFGAGLLVDGILLNNQMDDFSWEGDSPNLPEPGKRPRSSMAPMIVLEGGSPLLCLGTPGGLRIPSTMVEILLRHLALGQSLQEAMDAPRWYPAGTTLVIEPRFPAETTAALEGIGYRLYPMGPYDTFFGGAHGIRSAPVAGGSLIGAADPRRDGRAVEARTP